MLTTGSGKLLIAALLLLLVCACAEAGLLLRAAEDPSDVADGEDAAAAAPMAETADVPEAPEDASPAEPAENTGPAIVGDPEVEPAPALELNVIPPTSDDAEAPAEIDILPPAEPTPPTESPSDGHASDGVPPLPLPPSAPLAAPPLPEAASTLSGSPAVAPSAPSRPNGWSCEPQQYVQAYDSEAAIYCPPQRTGPAGRVFLRADALLWWTKGSQLPPLVTTSPFATPRDQAGVLGEPDTSIVYGNQTVNGDLMSGYRFVTGVALDCSGSRAIEADFLDFGSNSTGTFLTGNGAPILARPFYNIEIADQDAELVSFPSVASGSMAIDVGEDFQSTGAWLRCNVACCESAFGGCGGTCCLGRARGYRIDLIGGYRHYRLDDWLTIHEHFVATDQIRLGTDFDILEGFRTRNEFHGGEIGVQAQVQRGRWSLGVLAKMAIGRNRQEVTIDGRTITTVPGLLPVTGPGGLLTAPTNIGYHRDDQFTLIPQLGLELGYRLNCRLRAYVGYNLLYWAHVQRSADQIDTVVDPRNLPPPQAGGTLHPAPQLNGNDFWAQGLNLGVEVLGKVKDEG